MTSDQQFLKVLHIRPDAITDDSRMLPFTDVCDLAQSMDAEDEEMVRGFMREPPKFSPAETASALVGKILDRIDDESTVENLEAELLELHAALDSLANENHEERRRSCCSDERACFYRHNMQRWQRIAMWSFSFAGLGWMALAVRLILTWGK